VASSDTGLTTPTWLQTRAAALEVAEGLSGSRDGVAALAAVQHDLVPHLLACAADAATSRPALRVLVNVSADEGICSHVAQHGGCSTLVRLLVDDAVAHPDLVCMALANISRAEAASEQILQVWHGAASVRK
jgi:hypothetical protein